MSQKAETPFERMMRWAKAADMSQSELARALGMLPQHLNNWKKRGLPADHYETVAKLFRRSIDELVGRIPEKLVLKSGLPTHARVYSLTQVKVIGTATVGQDGFWTQIVQRPAGTGGDGFINMPTRDQNAYSLRIIGDDNQSRVRSGEYVVVEPGHELVPTEEALIILKDGRQMIRDYLNRANGYLTFSNIRGERLTLAEGDVERVHYIAGIAKQALHSDD